MNTIVIAATIISAVIGLILLSLTLSVDGYLKMTVPTHLPPGSAVHINGTSTSSNSTHTHCMVDVIINNQSYAATNPTGKNGSFATWNYLSGPVIHAGVNRVTAKYSCFAPTANASIPDFVYHHSANITSP